MTWRSVWMLYLFGFAQGADAVFEHRAACRKRPVPPADRRSKFYLRDDLIATFLGEEVEPFVELCHVDQRAVLGEQDRRLRRDRGSPHGALRFDTQQLGRNTTRSRVNGTSVTR